MERQFKQIVTYLLLVAIAVLCILGVLWLGAAFQKVSLVHLSATEPVAKLAVAPVAGMGNSIQVFLLQLAVIVSLATWLGWALGRIHQPAVIGEMLAGILLGPSVLGYLFPAASEYLFPPLSLPPLKLLAELGVILFMFLVGMETRIERMRGRARSALLVSHASIVIPFLLGIGLAIWIFEPLAPPGVAFVPFALFMGVGMSITAFPVLARIIEERGLKGTALGATALTCAMVDDVTAWCLLALVVAMVSAGSIVGVVLTVLLTVVFVGAMLWGVRPAVARWTNSTRNRLQWSKGAIALILFLVFLSSFTTETIGIHSVFGAFLAGAVVPLEATFRAELKLRLETLVSIVLLPVFFAYTGLRTEVGLLLEWSTLSVALVVLVLAVVGKLGGTMIAARVSGMNWRPSFALGVLMNTRGLVEIIVLNIGYDLGVLSSRVFAIMVFMALVTTGMAGPLLWLVPPQSEATDGTARSEDLREP